MRISSFRWAGPIDRDEVIIELGPGTIRGPSDVRPELIWAALEFIDDDIALLDEQPVPVSDVWDEVMRAVAGPAVGTVVLVCPAWWSSALIDRVRAAARTVARTVVVLERTRLLRAGISDQRTTTVEIASEFVAVTRPGARASVVPRSDDAAIAAEVAAAVGASLGVLVDSPTGVSESERLATAIAERMRASGIAVVFTDEDSVLDAAAALRARQHGQADGDEVRQRIDRRRGGTAVLVGVLAAAVLCGGFVISDGTAPHDEFPLRLLVEGRVGVMVPAAWTAQRITSGPGSARVQIGSSSDADVVLHITQSTDRAGRTLAATAESLRTALDEEPKGVFVDFNASDHRAEKAAVTYREVRSDHQVAWTVLIDGMVRIAIGCQSAPGREHLVRAACDQAIRSAHAVL